MNGVYIFIMRMVLGAVFAVVISRVFYPGKPVVYVAGLGVFLVLLAYLFEHFRNRKKNTNLK